MNYSVEKNIQKNRLYIRIAEKANDAFIKKTFYAVRSHIDDLKPGFGVIVDLSACDVIYISAMENYKKIIKYLADSKAGEIVRIVKKENLSFGQLNNLLNRIQSYNAIYVFSEQEAEEKLDHNVYRNGMRFTIKNARVVFSDKDVEENGTLIDISTSGCSIRSSARTIPPQGEISVSIFFDEHESIPSFFRANARIVRRFEDMFAVTFLATDEGFKERLYERLCFETCRVSVKPIATFESEN